MDRIIKLYFACHPAQERFAGELDKHFNKRPTDNHIFFEIINSTAPVGKSISQWKRLGMEECNIILIFVSADFMDSDESRHVEEFFKSGKPIVPILTSSCFYQNSFLKDISCLPETNKTLDQLDPPARAVEYASIVAETTEQASKILEARVQQSKSITETELSVLPEESIFAPTWSLRSEYRNNFFAREREKKPGDFLNALEHELQRIPILRITERERHDWWMLCLDYLDQHNPTEHLKKRLNSETAQRYLERKRQFAKDGQEAEQPHFLFPEDPIGEILRLWGNPALAARWLYLGIGYFGPKAPFIYYSGQLYDLYQHIQDYFSFLTDFQKRHVALCQKLHTAKCLGLLTAFPHAWQIAQTNDVDRAISILHAFRNNDTLNAVTFSAIQNAETAALLNLLGAQALWLNNPEMAEQAYQRAREKSNIERNPIGEWAAVEGLITVRLWYKDRNANNRSTPTHEQALNNLFRQREILKQERIVRYIEHYRNSHTQSVQARQCMQMLTQLANDPDQLRTQPALTVSYELNVLEEFVMDGEEMAFPLPMLGEAAALVGTLRLLSGLEVGDARLVDAVNLLIRYGSGGLEEKFRFFSPSIHPSRSDFIEIWRVVLRPGRNLSESLAKLCFLERYSRDLPPEFINEAHSLCIDILNQIPASSYGRSIFYLSGNRMCNERTWTAIDTIVEQQTLIAGHVIQKPSGASWILELLSNEDPVVWTRTLTALRISAWAQWWEIGVVHCDILSALADKISERLLSKDCELLFSEKNVSILFTHRDRIPVGITNLLFVCLKAGVSKEKIDTLHGLLCKLLHAFLQNRSNAYYEIFFSEPVFSWLISRKDKKTRQFVSEKIDACLESLSDFETSSSYFDKWRSLAEQLDALSPEQSNRLALIIDSLSERLFTAVKYGRWMTPAMLSLAASLLKSKKHPNLHAWAKDLIRASAPSRFGLVCLVAAPLHELGDMATSIERSILHCLRGLAATPWPWFPQHEKNPPSPEWDDASDDGVRDGIHAVHNIFFYKNTPPSGYRTLLVPTVAQIYSQVPKDAVAAVEALAMALTKVPKEVDLNQAVHALCWALARSERHLRDAALRTAVQHQKRLSTCPAWSELESALQRFTPPPTLSSAWALRMGELKAASAARRRRKQVIAKGVTSH